MLLIMTKHVRVIAFGAQSAWFAFLPLALRLLLHQVARRRLLGLMRGHGCSRGLVTEYVRFESSCRREEKGDEAIGEAYPGSY